jgi:hypothetical protein
MAALGHPYGISASETKSSSAGKKALPTTAWVILL